MKITILSINYYPQGYGIAPFATELSLYLSDYSKINILTPYPFSQKFSRIKKFKELENSNIRIKRIPIYLFNKANFINRVLFDTSFMINSLIFGGNELLQSDKLIVIAPPLQTGLVALFMKIFFRKRYIFYVQDIVPDLPIQLGILKNKFLIKILKKMEETIYNNADKIITISEGMAQNILKKCKITLTNDKIAAINNWGEIRPDNRIEDSPDRECVKSLGKQNKTIALYAGSFGSKQSLVEAIPFMKILDENIPDLNFLFIGEGPQKEEFIGKISQAKITNSIFLPAVDRNEIKQWESEVDLVFISQNYKITNELFPSKIVSAMCSGKPVLCLANIKSGLAEAVNNAQCGIVFDQNELKKDLIIKKVKKIINKEMLLYYEKNSLNYAKKNYDKDKLLKKFNKIICED